MTSWPCSASSAAATDESTPPDIATTMRIVRDQPRKHETTKRTKTTIHTEPTEPAEMGDSGCARRGAAKHCDDAVYFFGGRKHPEAEAKRVLRPVRRKPHRAQHVRRLQRARRAGRACRYGDTFEIERNEQALGFDMIEADVRGVGHAR